MAARHHRLIPLATLAAMALTAEPAVRWSERAAMPLPRAGYIAGTDGHRLLIAGGSYWEGDRKIWSGRADWYDPEADRWLPAPSLPAPRSDAACASAAGSIFVFGGAAGNVPRQDSLVLRDGAWHAVPEWTLPAPRMYAAAAVLAGRVYVAGGLTTAGDYAGAATTLWSRSLDGLDGWRTHAEIPGPRRAHFALAAIQGRLYVFGGMTQQEGKFVNLADTLEYDPASNRWRALPEAPRARRAWYAAGWRGRVLLFGGYSEDFSDEVFSFDPTSRRFTLMGHLPAAVADAKFLAVAGRFLSAGGESGPKVRAPWTWAGKLDVPERIVVALGDSVTLGARPGLVSPEATYPARLGAALPGDRVINAGVGGNDTRHLLARLDRDVLSQRPDLVLVMAGLNDAAYIDPGPVARTSPRVPPEEYRRNLSLLVNRIRTAGARVVLATPNPMTRAYLYAGLGFYATHDMNAALEGYREAVLDAARELQCPVVDLFAAWRDRRDLDRLLVDGIHPGVEGHARIAELLLPAIEEELRW